MEIFPIYFEDVQLTFFLGRDVWPNYLFYCKGWIQVELRGFCSKCFKFGKFKLYVPKYLIIFEKYFLKKISLHLENPNIFFDSNPLNVPIRNVITLLKLLPKNWFPSLWSWNPWSTLYKLLNGFEFELNEKQLNFVSSHPKEEGFVIFMQINYCSVSHLHDSKRCYEAVFVYRIADDDEIGENLGLFE